MRTHILRWLLIILLVLLSFVCVAALWHATVTSDVGKSDFIGYWSATYLLQHGQNPYDEASMGVLQHVQMKTEVEPTIMAWNPPTLFIFLLPLAWFSFTTARFLLLAINIIILLAAGLILARMYLPPGKPRLMVIYLLFVIGFPQALSAIYMGQVTFFVFLGLVASLALIKKEQWFWAGAVLVLTTIKPHLVILPLIYLLIYMARKRHYEGWIGLILAGAICAVVLFILRPNWIYDLIGLMAIAPIHWATPTIGGLLGYWQLSDAGRYLVLLFLPLPFLLLRYEAKINIELAVALLTLITVPTTFFGWSYDQTMLLIPIAQIFSWVSASKNLTFKFCIVSVVLVALGLNFYQRLFNRNDVFYLWVPLFWWLVFGVSWRYFSRTTQPKLDPVQPA